MQSFEFQELVDALRRLGLRRGDILNVHSRLFTLGSIRGTPVQEIPAAYLKAFREVIGPEGTVVVPTYTTTFGRFGTPFVLEESPSEMGTFSEYVRKLPGARRTLHPIQSLTALGEQADELTQDHPLWNVGHDSVWDRMLRRGAKFLSLGLPPRKSMSCMHQAEYLACAPYLYPKILRGEVIAGGVRIDHDFYLAARYLQYNIGYDLTRLDQDMESAGALRRGPLGGNAVWMVPMQDAFEIAMKGLRKDIYYLLQSVPTFREGEPPLDGTTIRREKTAPRYFLV